MVDAMGPAGAPEGGADVFSVGAVLSATWASFAGRAGYYMLLAFVCYIPTYLLTAYIVASDAPADAAAFRILNVILPLICNGVLSALAIYSVVMAADGRRPGLGDTWRAASPRIGHAIAVSFLVGLLTGFGILLFVVPGLIVGVMFAVAVPAVLVERSGSPGALSRSRALTKGRRWSIFGLLLLYYVVAGGVLFGIGYAIALEVGGDRGVAWSEAAGSACSLILAPLYAIAAAHAYLLLKQEKEGVDARALAEVFA